jgi:DNA-binding response OmpR family regulator
MQTTDLKILAVGRNAAILEVVNRLINAHEKWTGATAASAEEAVNAISTARYDIVLLCAGISEEEAAMLKQQLAKHWPHTMLLRHFGGGSGLLENEILAALDQQKSLRAR